MDRLLAGSHGPQGNTGRAGSAGRVRVAGRAGVVGELVALGFARRDVETALRAAGLLAHSARTHPTTTRAPTLTNVRTHAH